jgi:hypothetical protein
MEYLGENLRGLRWVGIACAASLAVSIIYLVFLESVFDNGLAQFVSGGRTFANDTANPLIAFLYSLPVSTWIIAQVFGLVFTSIGIGLLVFEITQKYKLIPALLATATPTIFFWTASATGEIPMMMFAAWGLFFIIRYTKTNNIRFGIASGVLIGGALLSRGTLVLFPLGCLAALIAIGIVFRKQSIISTLKFALIPLAIPFAVITIFSAQNYANTGYWFWSAQSGQHLLQFVYPCLTKTFACGKRDGELLEKIDEEFDSRIKSLPPELMLNVGARNKLQTEMGIEKLWEQDKLGLLISATASFAKILIYTPLRNLLARQGITQGSLWNSDYGLEERVGSRAIWRKAGITLIEMMNILLLLIQILGVIFLIRNPATREAGLIIGLFALSVLFTGLGIGNPRYRAALEVVLIPLAFSSLGAISAMVRRKGR